MVVLVDRNMMLTPDEYMALMRLISSERESEGATLSQESMNNDSKPRRRSRKARTADRKLSMAFKEANRRYRKKDGSLRNGRSQADIARLAHRLRKKM